MSSDDASAHAQSRAILIGTSRYSDPYFPPLPAVANSLRGMVEVLTDPALCGWPAERITVWKDPTDVRKVARNLRRLARETTGVLLVYFAGHGTIVRRGQLCMVLTDTESADADISGLEFERVREALLASPARTKIVILDCCYSGRAIEALSGAIADSTETHGAYTLTASDHTAHVVAPDQQTYTATSFTDEFLTLIRTGIAGGPANLTLDYLYVNLRYRLRVRGLPEPNQRSTDTVARYVFTRNAAASPAEPHTPLPLLNTPARSGTALPHKPQQRPPEAEPSTEAKPLRSKNKIRPLVPIGPAVTWVPHRVPLHRVLLGTWILLVILLAAAISHPIIHWLYPPNPPTATLTGPTGSVNSVAFTHDGKTLAGGSSDGKVWLWDVATKTRTATLSDLGSTISHLQGADVVSVAFSRDGKTLASGESDGEVWLWDVATKSHTAILDGYEGQPTSEDDRINSVAFSRDGKTLASGGEGGTVQLWNVATEHPRPGLFADVRYNPSATLTGPTGSVNSVAFSPDGRTLASGSKGGTVQLWNVATKHTTTRTSQIAIDGVVVYSVAFSRDGRTLASGSSNGTVQLWDVATQHNTATLPDPKDSITSMALSLDGKTLAGGNDDNTVRLWDIGNRHTTTLTGPTGTVVSVAFSPDGKILASGSLDKTVRLWKIPP